MVRLAWRMLWQRPARFVGTFTALGLAVAMVTAFGTLLASGIGYHGAVARYAAAPVLVAATDVSVSDGSGPHLRMQSYPLTERPRLAVALAARIAAAPGVAAAIGDTAIDVQVRSSTPAAAEIHPWSAARLAPFRLATGAAPATAGQIVIGASLAARTGARPGQRLPVATPSGVRTFTVTGVAAPARGSSSLPPTAFVSDAEAATLTGNAPQVIGVLPRPGVSARALAAAVRAALPRRPAQLSGAYPQVYTGANRGRAESLDVENAQQFIIAISSVFGAATLLIATFVIAGTVGLSVRQRHRDMALLRAIAATPRQVRRMVVRETIFLGLGAAAAGVWPGLSAVGWLRGQLVSRGMVPGTFQTASSWIPALVAAAAALVTGAAAAWLTSLRASRVRPAESLAEGAVERSAISLVRAGLGLAVLPGGVTLCIVSESVTATNAPAIAVAAVFTLAVAVALLSPLLIRATAATAGRALLAAGITGRLAAACTRASSQRLSTVVSSLVLAVALSGSLWFVMGSAEHVATQQSTAGLQASYVITPAAPGLPPGAASAVARTSGVAAATPVVQSSMLADQDSNLNSFTSQGLDPARLGQTLDLGVTRGSLSGLHGDTVAVDTLTAQGLHLSVGSQFRGWFGDGTPANLRVIAVYARGLGFAQLTVPHDLLLAHTTARTDSAVFIASRPGDPGTSGRLQAELNRVAPGASVQPHGAYQTSLDQNLVENAWADQVLVGVLVLYVVIAMINTLTMYTLDRGREFAALQLAGTTRRQVLRMTGLERVLLLGLALVLGAAIAAATLIPLVKGITGSAVPYIPLSAWITVIGGVIVLGTLASSIPTRRLLRTPPVRAIGARE